MDISAFQELIRQEIKLKAEIKRVSAPQITDTELIQELYRHFSHICKGRGQSATDKGNRQLFVASVIMLYSPMTFAGRKLPKGVRTPLARVMGYNTPEAVSMVVRQVVSYYRIYHTFEAEVDELCALMDEFLTT